MGGPPSPRRGSFYTKKVAGSVNPETPMGVYGAYGQVKGDAAECQDTNAMNADAASNDSMPCLGYDESPPRGESGSSILDKHQALDRFLARVEKRAFRIAEIATNNADEALDIVQDAMFKLVEKYAHKPEDEWGALFHRILQSRIHDWYRRRQVRRRVWVWFGAGGDDGEGEDPIQLAEDTAGRSPEALLQSARGMQGLDRALRELPLRQQQAFLLRVWEGLDVRQTALAMGCAEGSVKTHYSRAVHTLREKLSDYWD